MASKKKESEGIALLSMYNDEDEDIEDMDEDERENTEDGEDFRASDRVTSEFAQEASPSLLESEISLPGKDSIPQIDRVPTPTPQAHNLLSTQPSVESQRRRKGTLAIVDYAHDETAMSPEAEEGEILIAGRVMFGAELQTANGILLERTPPGTVQILTPGVQATTPQPSEQPEPSQSDSSIIVNSGKMELEAVQIEETVMVSVETQGDVDALEKFLPPPPKTKCSEDLQEKINRFLALKRAGKSFNAEVRNRKDYRNPDFLQHAVRYQELDEIGSCFSKDVFDPHGYSKSDYFDEIEVDMKREMERKEQEKKKSQKVEFVAGGTQPGMVSMAPKISMQVSGAPTVASSGLHSLQTAADAVARDSRQNKKSKWMVIEEILFILEDKILYLPLGHMQHSYPLQTLVLDIALLHNKGEERLKRKNLVREEDHEFCFWWMNVYRSSCL